MEEPEKRTRKSKPKFECFVPFVYVISALMKFVAVTVSAGELAVARVRTINEIVNEVIKQFEKAKKDINIVLSPFSCFGTHTDAHRTQHSKVRITKKISAQNGLSKTPKLVEIIAAVPDNYRKKLEHLLKAKPIRSASGVRSLSCLHTDTVSLLCSWF